MGPGEKARFAGLSSRKTTTMRRTNRLYSARPAAFGAHSPGHDGRVVVSDAAR